VFRRLGLEHQDVLIRGRRHPMVGVVTMDQVMVDLGPDTDVELGDEAVLLGAQGEERITPDEWAGRLDTIAYEVVCAIGPRVERRYSSS
jgi:alanine racemase